MSSLLSTATIGTLWEVHTNYFKQKTFNIKRNECAYYFKCNKSRIEYNKVYKKGNKKGWKFEIVKDIV